MKHVKRFFQDELGAELSEYAVAIALLVVVAVVIYSILGQSMSDQNSGTGAKVKNVDRTFPFN
jgi:Flp pilus assembly pilin Flp